MNKDCGIYYIKNKLNNKRYIGSSKHISLRKIQHIDKLNRNIHHNIHLQDDYAKYGEDMFEFGILQLCLEDERHIIEQQYIDKYWETGELYNMAKNVGSPNYNMGSQCYNAKKVICLTTNKYYDTISEAAKENNIAGSSISNVCKGKYKYTYGNERDKYEWRYLDENDEPIDNGYKCKRGKKIICISNGMVYHGAYHIYHRYGIDIASIKRSCYGEELSAGRDRYKNNKLIWRYLEGNNILLPDVKHLESRIKPIKCITTNKYYLSIPEICKEYPKVQRDRLKYCISRNIPVIYKKQELIFKNIDLSTYIDYLIIKNCIKYIPKYH